MVPVGIDVAAKTLAVAYRYAGRNRQRQFANSKAGRAQLVAWLPDEVPCRVVVEATGFYSFDISITLDERDNTEVMIANPRAIAAFSKALMARAKTDPLDAIVLMEYAQRMPFTAWLRPSKQAMELRAITRRIRALVKTITTEKNRYSSAAATQETPDFILEDIAENIASMKSRVERLKNQALSRIQADSQLHRRFELLVSMTGVASTSAVRLLGALGMLPRDMTVRQWVAHAGLDPRPWKSGTSIDRPTRVTKAGNKHLRHALFMPALVAIQRDEVIQAYYQHLLDGGKKPLQATVAVMRKYLHAIYGMFRTDQPFDSRKLFPAFSGGAKGRTGAGSPEPACAG